MKLFLLGLPGSGKSTLGKQLALALGVEFIDLDTEIERREGRAIREIFKENKEDYFRMIESAELKQWCVAKKNFVMATGGGAPCFFDNMALINDAGISVFLDVPPVEIAKRIARTKVEERPLLAASGVEGLKDHIEFMRSNRISFYRMAKLVFPGENIQADDILKAIKS